MRRESKMAKNDGSARHGKHSSVDALASAQSTPAGENVKKIAHEPKVLPESPLRRRIGMNHQPVESAVSANRGPTRNPYSSASSGVIFILFGLMIFNKLITVMFLYVALLISSSFILGGLAIILFHLPKIWSWHSARAADRRADLPRKFRFWK